MTTTLSKPWDDIWETLTDAELYWRDRYDWFLAKGYRLRPRYNPRWIPSWKTNPALPEGLTEDSMWLKRAQEVNDAIRIEDDTHVVLKRVPHVIADWQTQEAAIMQYFSRKDIASDPRNHCVPCLEVLRPPTDTDGVVAVMPILRAYENPEFETVGEAVDFIRQILEGFEFLHEHCVAHRDVRVDNLMMDPNALGFERFHFARPQMRYNYGGMVKARKTRTESRPKYYIIDFGFSSQYQTTNRRPREYVRPASDGSLPELKHRSRLFDPFPIDVYYVGNFIRMDFIDGNPEDKIRKGRIGFEFLRPLINIMTKENPNDRITMSEAVKRFDEIVSRLPKSVLRSQSRRIYGPYHSAGNYEMRAARRIHYWYRRVKYTVLNKPPIPAGGD